MGTERNYTQYQGILAHEKLFGTDTLAAKGAGATDSDYTQAGSKPGTATPDQTSDLVLALSGTQSEDGSLKIRTNRAGHPGAGGRGGMLWRDVDGGDSSSEYKGWDTYGTVTGWQDLYRTVDVTAPILTPHVIRLKSGKLLACGIECLGANPEFCQRYDPATSSWTGIEVAAASDLISTTTPAATIMELDSGRVVLYIGRTDFQADAYYSDDEGDTWAIYAERVLEVPSPAAITEMRCAYSNGDAIMLVGYNDGTLNLTQSASDDFGQSFTRVVSDWNTKTAELPELLNVFGKRDSGFFVSFYDGTATTVLGRHISTAFESIQDVDIITTVAIGSVPQGLAVWEDEDGKVYALNSEGTGLTVINLLSRSLDGGYTWEEWNAPAIGLDGVLGVTDYFKLFGCNSTGGRALMLTHYEANTNVAHPMTVSVVELGGWSRHTQPAVDGSTEFPDVDYLTWWNVVGGLNALVWLPMERPNVMAAGGVWGAVGAGVDNLTITEQLRIVTAANTRYFTRTIPEDPDAINVEIEIQVTAGEGSLAADDIAARIVHSDNVAYERDISIRFTDAAYRLWDNVAAAQIGSDEAVDFTTATHVRLTMSKGSGAVDKVKTWWSVDGHVREFVEGPGGDATDTGGAYASDNVYWWGHIAGSTDTSYWKMFAYNHWATRWNERATTNPGGAWTNPTHLHTMSYPTLPMLIHDGVKVQATSGPTAIGEVFTANADYDYPFAAVFGENYGSPRRGWRSTADNVAMSFVFDLEALFADAFLDSSTIAMALFGSNLTDVELHRRVGAAWTTILTLDSSDGYSNLKYIRDGRKLQPDQAQATQGERFMWRNALAGAQFDMGAGTDAERYKRILRNTSGSWVGTGGTTKRPILVIDGDTLDGGEAASGTGAASMPNFAGVLHDYEEDEDVYRIYIPAQKTAEGYYEIGTLLVGGVNIFGKRYDRNWSTSQIHNVEITTMPDGTRSTRKRGPVRRELGFAWVDTSVDASAAQIDDPSPDYVAGTTAGVEVATKADTLRMLEGLLAEIDGASTPVAMLLKIPVGSGDLLINDPPLLMLARIESDPTRETPRGLEGSTEDEKLNTIIAVEEV